MRRIVPVFSCFERAPRSLLSCLRLPSLIRCRLEFAEPLPFYFLNTGSPPATIIHPIETESIIDGSFPRCLESQGGMYLDYLLGPLEVGSQRSQNV